MMIKWHPWKIILLAGGMMFVSILLPLLMILQVLRSTFFLNFLAYGLSVAGMILGFIGMVSLVRINRSQQKYKDQQKELFK
jgi:hypothetical protein